MTVSSKSSFSTKPALVPTWSHVPNTRLFIQKDPASQAGSSEAKRIATLIKSSRQVLHFKDFQFAKLTFFGKSSRAQNWKKKRGGGVVGGH